MSTPVSTTFDGLASVDRYGNLAPIVVDRLDERYGGALPETATDEKVAALTGDTTSATRPAIVQVISEGAGTVSAAEHGVRRGATAAENTAALSAALSAAQSRGGMTVQLPAGQFEVAPIDLSQWKAQLRGVGGRLTGNQRANRGSAQWGNQAYEGTVLRAPAGMSATDAVLVMPHKVEADGATLADLTIIGRGEGMGIRMGWLQEPGQSRMSGWPVRPRITNINIGNFHTGLATTSENSVFIAPYIAGCEVGFGAKYPFNGNVVVGLNVEKCTTAAVLLDHAITNRFVGGVLQANVPTLGGIVVQNAAMENVFESIYMENHNSDSTYTKPVYDVSVGDGGYYGEGTGTCYGNAFLDMHFGAPTGQNSRIRILNAIGTRVTSRHSASDTPNPPVELAGGYGHEVIGMWPSGVTGAAVSRSTVHNWAGAGANTTARWGHNAAVASDRWIATGSVPATSLPTGEAGAAIRNASSGALMLHNGTEWLPSTAHIEAKNAPVLAAGATGDLEATAALGVTHIRVAATGAGASYTAPNATTTRIGRAITLHNWYSNSVEITPRNGQKLNGGTNPLTLPPKGTTTIYCDAAAGWVTVA